jgi:hypothetical protein
MARQPLVFQTLDFRGEARPFAAQRGRGVPIDKGIRRGELPVDIIGTGLMLRQERLDLPDLLRDRRSWNCPVLRLPMERRRQSASARREKSIGST